MNQWVRMKIFFWFAFFLTLIFSVSCSPVYDVKSDHPGRVELTKLETYDFIPQAIPAESDSLDIQKLQLVVNEILQNKGYRPFTRNPDFLVFIKVDPLTRLRKEADPYIALMAPYTAPAETSYQEVNVVFTCLAPDSQKLIWRGSAKIEVATGSNLEQIEAMAGAAIEKVLKKLPAHETAVSQEPEKQ